MNITIDPTKLDSLKSALLYQLLQENKDYLSFDYNYTLEFDGKHYDIKLTDSVIARERKPGKDQQARRYEVLGGVIDKGAFGTIASSKGTLVLDKDMVTFKEKPKGKQRIIKLVVHDYRTSSLSTTTTYDLTKTLDHLRVKPPTTVFNASFCAMKKAPGPNLDVLLKKKVANFTPSQRLDLTLALINALKEQVIGQQLVHRDIKPANIMVDDSQWPPRISIIDYDFSKKQGTHDGKNLGTPAYVPPETWTSNNSTEKSDIYSMGIVLQEVWGGDKLKHIKTHWEMEQFAHSSNKQFPCLFHKVASFSANDKKIIGDIIHSMTDAKLERRPSVDDCINILTQQLNTNSDYSKSFILSQQKSKVEANFELTMVNCDDEKSEQTKSYLYGFLPK
jgi:serine/threonine-protein kinase LegK1